MIIYYIFELNRTKNKNKFKFIFALREYQYNIYISVTILFDLLVYLFIYFIFNCMWDLLILFPARLDLLIFFYLIKIVFFNTLLFHINLRPWKIKLLNQ